MNRQSDAFIADRLSWMFRRIRVRAASARAWQAGPLRDSLAHCPAARRSGVTARPSSLRRDVNKFSSIGSRTLLALTQDESLDLAAGGLRQLVDEFHPTWVLVRLQALAHKRL